MSKNVVPSSPWQPSFVVPISAGIIDKSPFTKSTLKGFQGTPMEALLSLAFDNLSSYDGAKIRKGLRQVEGLLAQICLSRQKSTPAEKRRSVIVPGSTLAAPKELACLKEDPAFREFF